MENVNMNELNEELVEKVMNCETAEELMAVVKAEGGQELTKEETQMYIEKLPDFELDDETLKKAAGGGNLAEDFGKLFQLIGGLAQVFSPKASSAGN